MPLYMDRGVTTHILTVHITTAYQKKQIYTEHKEHLYILYMFDNTSVNLYKHFYVWIILISMLRTL